MELRPRASASSTVSQPVQAEKNSTVPSRPRTARATERARRNASRKPASLACGWGGAEEKEEAMRGSGRQRRRSRLRTDPILS